MVNEAYTRNTIETCTYGDAAENPCYLRGVNCVCKESLDQMAQSPVANLSNQAPLTAQYYCIMNSYTRII